MIIPIPREIEERFIRKELRYVQERIRFHRELLGKLENEENSLIDQLETLIFPHLKQNNEDKNV